MKIFSKKGVDTIIAVLLVVMITIAAAGSFYFWYMRVQQEAQGRTEQSTSTFLNQINTCIKFPYFAYSTYTNKSEVQVQNCGSTSITIGDGDDNVLISSEPCAFTVDSQVCDTCPLVIGPGALAKFEMNFNRATCSGTNETAAKILSDGGNIEHKITFSLEGAKATSSKSFTPEAIIPSESCSVVFSGASEMSFPSGSGYNYNCTTYTATLSGAKARTFDIIPALAPDTCSFTYVPVANPCGELQNDMTQVSLTPDTPFSFVLTIYRYSSDPPCNLTTTLNATNIACTAQLNLTTKNNP